MPYAESPANSPMPSKNKESQKTTKNVMIATPRPVANAHRSDRAIFNTACLRRVPFTLSLGCSCWPTVYSRCLEADNVRDHRARTSDRPFQNHAQVGLRVHRNVIRRSISLLVSFFDCCWVPRDMIHTKYITKLYANTCSGFEIFLVYTSFAQETKSSPRGILVTLVTRCR